MGRGGRLAGGAAVVAVIVGVVLLAGCSSGGGDQEVGPTTTIDPGIGATVVSTVDPPEDEQTVAGPAPRSVVAAQGPVEESARYVSVTWSHVDLDLQPDLPRRTSGYDIERDGRIVGSTEVDEEPWDDLAFRDREVPLGVVSYRVRARFDDGPGPWSEPTRIEVLGSDDFGPVFAVDDQSGSDLQRAQAAVDAAEEAGGGVVLFGPRTYEFDDALLIFGNGILLRGAGTDETVLRAAFPGGEDSCGQVAPLLLFRGDTEELGVSVRDTADRGDTTLRLDGRPRVEVGDLVEVDGVTGQMGIRQFESLGIAVDPSTGRDERYPFDAGVVQAVDGDSISFEEPLSPIVTEGSSLYRYTEGWNNGVELLTVDGPGPDETSYHRLIDARSQVDFRVSEVTARWANRNVLDVSGHGITIVGLTATEVGAAGYQPEPCKYKVGIGPATDVVVVDSELGAIDNDENMSLLTTQFVYRAVIRNSILGRSRTYGFNEHGGGSRDLVVENNWIGAGPSGWSGILLGNDTWGFSGETAIRNNRFVDNVIDVLMVENPYGVVIVGNRSENCGQTCVSWSGWGEARDGGAPAIADPGDYGSARLAIVANRFAGANGIDLGADESNGFPWLGIRDAVVADNVVDAADGSALTIRGDATSSGRLWVTGNTLAGGTNVSEPGPDWWLWDNIGGLEAETTDAAWPEWLDLYQPWENGEATS